MVSIKGLAFLWVVFGVCLHLSRDRQKILIAWGCGIMQVVCCSGAVGLYLEGLR